MKKDFFLKVKNFKYVRFFVLMTVLGFGLNAWPVTPTGGAPTPDLTADNLTYHWVYGAGGNPNGVSDNCIWGTSVSSSGAGSVSGSSIGIYPAGNEQCKKLVMAHNAGGGNAYAQLTVSSSGLDIQSSDYTMLHIDYYVEDITAGNKFRIVLRDGANYDLTAYDVTAATSGWNSHDIVLNKTNTQLASLKYIRFYNIVGAAGSVTAYVDNIYFYGYIAEPDVLPHQAPIPPDRIAGTYTSVYSDAAGYGTTAGSWSGRSNSSVSYTNESVELATGDNAQKIVLTHNSGSANAYAGYDLTAPVDAIALGYDRIHFDIWLDNANSNIADFRMSLFAQYVYTLICNPTITESDTGKWLSFDVNLSSFLKSGNITGLSSPVSSIRFYAMTMTGGNITFYVDNIYFYKHISAVPDYPTDNADYDSNDIIAIYGEYVPGEGLTTKASGWDNTSEITDNVNDSEGNPVQIMYRKLTPSGVNPSTITIGSSYTSNMLVTPNSNTANAMHLDVWVENNSSQLEIALNEDYSYTVPASGLVPGEWNTLLIPLEFFRNGATTFSGTSLTGIEFYSANSSTIYVDNIYFGLLKINVVPVAEVDGNQYYSIREAYMAHRNDGGPLNIAVIYHSYESERIDIDADKSSFTDLTIYSKGGTWNVISTMPKSSYLWDYLFRVVGDFASTGRSVTFNGKQDKTGDPQSLIIQGKTVDRDITSPYFNEFTNATIYINGSNVFVKDCKFKGQSQFNRPEFTLRCSGYNIEISDNYFENCMMLEKNYTKAGARYAIAIINFNTRTSYVSKNNKINNNHFYETDPIYSLASSSRYLIQYSPSAGPAGEGSEITGNKFGGTGRVRNPDGTVDYEKDLAGQYKRLQYGTGGAIPSEALFGSMIFISSTSPRVIDESTAGIMRIEDNEIAYMDIVSPTSRFYDADGITYTEGAPGIDGITATEGRNVIKNNKIHDISYSSLAAGNSTSYFFSGIRAVLSGASNTINIVENNEIYNNNIFYTEASSKPVTVSGIHARISSPSSGVQPKILVKGNRVVTGANASNIPSAGYNSAIALHCEGTSAEAAQIDAYDNIVVINELTGGAENNNGLNGFTLYFQDNGGKANLYNNIIYVQGKTASSFTGNTAINAINIRSGSTSMGNEVDINIFHNTILLKNINSSTNATRALYFQSYASQSNNNVFNNIVVNYNAESKDMLTTGYRQYAGASDYNTYYSPNSAALYGQGGGFDYLKFDYWKRETYGEHDYHSLFIEPDFTSIADITDFTPAGIKVLITNLRPKRFLGGQRVEDALMASLVDPRDNDSDNNDIRGTFRRANLPTMGAINTAFEKYWIGTNTTDWNTQDNWGGNSGVPGDNEEIVFAPMVASGGTTLTCKRTLVLDNNRKVSHIYNDTDFQTDLNGKILTVTGGVWQARNASQPTDAAKIIANGNASTIVYNGDESQHIFTNTFVNNEINNLTLNNQSEYFVLSHGDLNISNDFAIQNPNTGVHKGALNMVWYNTTLTFSGSNSAGNTPDLSTVASYNAATPYTYRPYTGQRIPRHAIYNDSVYNLVSNSNKLVNYHDKLLVKNDLTIGSAGNLEIAADKIVQVFGTTANNRGAAGLVIKSREAVDATESALNAYLFPTLPRPNATFIYKSTTQGQAEINATVEMHSPASLYASEQESSSGIKYQNAWQYFTPAVRSAAASAFAGAILYQYNPKGDNTGAYTVGSPYWVPISTLDATKGYTITQNTPTVHTMTGALPNNTFTIPATDLMYYKFNPTNDPNISAIWPDDDDTNQGQFLIGNPFTHAISIKDLSFPDNFEQTVYIYNTGSFIDRYDAGNGSSAYFGDQPGENIVIPINQAGKNVGGKILPASIPSMQGFTIKFLDGTYAHQTAAGGDFSSKYISDKTILLTDGKNNDRQRSVKTEKDTCTLHIQLKNGDYFDEMLLVGYEGTGKGFDNGWDGKKELNAARALSIFTIEQEQDMSTSYYQISTMEDLDKTNLGIIIGGNEEVQAKLNATHELTLNGHNLDKFYYKIYLEDLKTGTLVDLLNSEASYAFESDATGEIENRFRIVTMPKEETNVDDNTMSNDNIEIYCLDKNIVINGSGELSGTVSLYDLSGRCIIAQDMDGGRQANIKTDLIAGAYIVRIATGNNTVNKTIILK